MRIPRSIALGDWFDGFLHSHKHTLIMPYPNPYYTGAQASLLHLLNYTTINFNFPSILFLSFLFRSWLFFASASDAFMMEEQTFNLFLPAVPSLA